MGIFEPICLELKSLRYLMNNIILKLHAQNEMLEVLFRSEEHTSELQSRI